MNDAELREEWNYRYQERLGILCEDRVPTSEEDQIARKEADETVAKLKTTNHQTSQ